MDDSRRAVSLLREAAENGNTGEMLTLGLMYDEGIGVTQDYAEAYVWYSVAVMLEDKDAEKLRDTAESKLTSSEKLAAQSRASELFEQIQKSMVK